MARLLTSGFETQVQSTSTNYHGETQHPAANGPVWLNSGSPTFNTSTPRSGAACMSCAASNAFVRISGFGIYGTLDRTYFTRVCLRAPDATPSSQIIVADIQISTVSTVSLRLNTDGTLGVYDANVALIGSATSALSADTWYCAEIESMIPTASTGTVGLRLDGTEITRSTAVDVNNSVTSPRIHVGNCAATSGVTILIDDVAINDNQGSDQNSHCGLGKVILLKPISDNALGTGWEAPQTSGSDTTDIYTAVDNTPPLGVVHADTDANNGAYVFNIANVGSTSNYDVNCATYTTGGVGSSDTVVLTQALVRATTASTTGTNNFAVQNTSNPADSGAVTGLNLELGAVGGTEPTGWKSYRGNVTYAPSVTLGSSPVVRASRTETGQTRAHQVDLMGLLVEYLPVSFQTVPLDAAAAQSAATLTTLTATTQVPLASSPAASAATLALSAQTQVTLAQADALSAATLTPTAPSQVPLGQADALSAATLTLSAATQVPLGQADAVSNATATVTYPGVVLPLGTAAAQSGTDWFHLDAYDPYADVTKSSSATFYWRFEETDVARDHGAFGDIGVRTFDGTYVGSPTLGAGALARAATEQGITFVSASSQRVTATASGFGSSLGTATIEFFVKTTTSGRGVILGVANSGTGSSNVTSLLIRANTDAAGNALAGATRFYLSDNAAAEMRCHITTNIYDGNWHHVVGVVGASGWEVYVDGAGVTESSASGTPGTYNNFNVALDIGALNFQGTHTQYFDGSLDEVAIYSTRFNASGVAVHYVLSKLYLTLATSPAQSAATLTLSAPTAIPLATSPAQSAATLAFTAATQVPLQSAAALSAATLALTGPTQIPLGTSAAQSVGALTLAAPTLVPLGTAAAQSDATLTLAPFVDDYAAVVIGDGPTAYWRLGESSGTTAEEYNNLYDGTYQATPTLAQTGAIATSSDTAVSFDRASGEAVSVADNVNLRPGTSDYSLEFWIKRNGNPSALEWIYAKPGGGAATSMDVRLTTGGLVELRNATTAVLTTTSAVTDNAWHHVVFAMDRGLTSHVYVDGTSDNTATSTTTDLNNGSILVIGARFTSDTYNNGLTASLDEVAWYKGTVLSAAQVLEHYETAQGAGPATVPLGTCAAQSASTLALKAATVVPLGTAASLSAASLALSAPTRVPLGTSAAQSASSLVLAAATAVPLATSAAQSSGTLALRAPTQVPLGTAAAQSSATCSVTIGAVTVPLGASAAQSSATLAITAPTQIPLATSAAQSASTITFVVPVTLTLGTATVQSTGTLTLSYPVAVPLGSSAAQSAATAVIGIYVPPVDTFPDLGARDYEVTTGGVFDQALTGGTIAEGARSGLVVNLRGGVVTESVRSGEVEITLGGYFAEGQRSAALDESSTGGYHDEDQSGASEDWITGARPDEALTGADTDYRTGADTDEDERSGEPDQVLTGGEIY